MPSALELPTDRPRRNTQSFVGATQFFTLPKRLASTLQALAASEGVTTFMLLLAAFDVLVQRYTGQTDIVVGTPIANRTRAELEGIVGCFVNALVLRAEVALGMTFRALLRQVRDATLDAYAHQDVPFEKLVEVMRPDRSQARSRTCRRSRPEMSASIRRPSRCRAPRSSSCRSRSSSPMAG